MEEFRLGPVEIIIEGDASAAHQNAAKLGPGRIKHLEASAYFIKEAARKKVLKLVKVPRSINYADIHTHYLNTKDFDEAMKVTGTKSAKELPRYQMLEQHRVNSF